ncbi:MAG: SufB/SufD family protein [Cyanobacteriota bacterium]|jgi:FeS assembly protein SufD
MVTTSLSAPSLQPSLQGLALPSRRLEDWRFTDPTPIGAIAPQLLTAQPLSSVPAPLAGTVRLDWNAPDPLAGVCLPAGITPLAGPDLEARLGEAVGACAAGSPSPSWLVQFDQALAPRTLALCVSASVETTLELVSDAAEGEGLLPLRLLLWLEPGARLELLEVHRSRGRNLTSVVVEAHLCEGAELRHGVLGQGHPEACLLAHLAVTQAPGSSLTQAVAASGWALARIEPRVLQQAGAASTCLRGLQRVEGRQIADTHAEVAFGGPEGRLDQLHKVVADGEGRSVFNGAVRVPRPAQRTEAAQLSRTLLLSDRARIDTKPELEIVADDVKCAHGATVSRLQQNELFYLQSRGIGAAQASRLLLRGFCEEVLAALPAAASVWQPLHTLLAEEGSGS